MAADGRSRLKANSLSQNISGIRVASSDKSDVLDALGDIRSAFDGMEPQHLIVFFANSYDADLLNDTLNTLFPDVTISGCSTAGEISPVGMIDDSLVAIAFPKDGFRIRSETIENITEKTVDQAAVAARRLKAKLNLSPSSDKCDNVFAMLIVDGLSNVEEQLVASINWALGDVQLIGGSAADRLDFENTTVISNGQTLHRSAILILFETDIPFRVFKTQNFSPTDTKLVVTHADAEKRVVHELNAEPASQEYAKAIGLMTNELGPFSYASHPLVVKVGGDYYCRSIRNINDDDSLSFFCAIDEGLVFTVATPVDILDSTRQSLENIDRDLGGIDVVIGFECILRRLDAETRQVRRDLAKIYREFSVVGFQTYGEQFNSMHLNQTLTGIAFGPRSSSNDTLEDTSRAMQRAE